MRLSFPSLGNLRLNLSPWGIFSSPRTPEFYHSTNEFLHSLPQSTELKVYGWHSLIDVQSLSGRGCSIKAKVLKPTEEGGGGRYQRLPETMEHIFRRLFPGKHETSLETDDEDDESEDDGKPENYDNYDDYDAYESYKGYEGYVSDGGPEEYEGSGDRVRDWTWRYRLRAAIPTWCPRVFLVSKGKRGREDLIVQ